MPIRSLTSTCLSCWPASYAVNMSVSHACIDQLFVSLYPSVMLTCICCSQHASLYQSDLWPSPVCHVNLHLFTASMPFSHVCLINRSSASIRLSCHVNLRPFAASMSIGHVCLYQHLFSLYPSMSVTRQSQPVCLLVIRQYLSVCHTILHFVETSMPVHVNQNLNIYQTDDN